jgi:hypothetical protein
MVQEMIIQTNFLSAEYLEDEQVILCRANTDFIPKSDFMEFFEKMKEIIKVHSVKCLIFDKTKLKVFDQGSMEWYHIHWKPIIKKEYGLKTYRKLLPKDNIFRISVEIGKKKIAENNPTFSFDDFDIKYVESVEEALKSF